MYRGYVKLWRCIDENPIATRPAYLSVFLFIVRNANHQDNQIIWNNRKTMIKRGSFITSAEKIAQGTGVPRATVKRLLEYLENEAMIELHTTKRFSLVSVIKYKDYQSSEPNNEPQVSHKRATSEPQVATNKNVEEGKRMKKTVKSTPGVQEILNMFYEINPSLNFGSPFERKACEAMLAKWPLDSVKAMAAQVIACQSEDRYAPRATTPSKMWTKIGEFQAYFKTKGSNKRKVAVI